MQTLSDRYNLLTSVHLTDDACKLSDLYNWMIIISVKRPFNWWRMQTLLDRCQLMPNLWKTDRPEILCWRRWTRVDSSVEELTVLAMLLWNGLYSKVLTMLHWNVLLHNMHFRSHVKERLIEISVGTPTTPNSEDPWFDPLASQGERQFLCPSEPTLVQTSLRLTPLRVCGTHSNLCAR